MCSRQLEPACSRGPVHAVSAPNLVDTAASDDMQSEEVALLVRQLGDRMAQCIPKRNVESLADQRRFGAELLLCQTFSEIGFSRRLIPIGSLMVNSESGCGH